MTHPNPSSESSPDPGTPSDGSGGVEPATELEPEPEPAPEPASRGRRALAWVSVLAVVVLGAGSLAAADLPAAPLAGGEAARFVPADGAAMLVTSSDGSRAVHESARDTGPSLLLDLPGLAGGQVFSSMPAEGLETLQLWRESITPLEGDRPQSSTIHVLDDRGVSMLTSIGGEVGFVYTPSIVLLPADAAPGATWEGEGDAMPGGILRYTIRGEVTAGDEGCLVATSDSRYLAADSDEALLELHEAATWCPGRGVVAATADVSGEPTGFASVPLPPAAELDRDAPRTESAPPAWSAGDWRGRDLSFVLSDPVYGDAEQGTPFDGLAATTASGVLVSSFSSRLVAYGVEDAVATRRWVASPGGDLLTLTAIGDVVLAATAARRLVAYDDHGVRLWATSFPDVLAAPLSAAPGGDTVAVSLDGTLRRLDLATGEELWSVDLRTDIDAAPAVVGDAVVLVDRGGAVLARSLADGAEVWSTEVPLAERAAAGDGIVAVQRSSGGIHVLDAADGSALWRGDQDGAGRAVAVAAGRVLARTDEGVQAWDAEGAALWSSPAGDWLAVGAAGRVVLVGAGAVELRDRDGRVLERVELAAADLGVSRLHVPTERGILVVQSNTTGFEVGG